MKIDYEKVAKIMYEAVRFEIESSGEKVILAKWEDRNEEFRKQYVKRTKNILKGN